MLDSYALKTEVVTIGASEYKICSLLDTNQAPSSYEQSRAAGIPDAYWALFGVLWDTSRVLASYMNTIPVDDRRTLEIGCGLALPGMVAAKRGFDITVSDVHPLAKTFLERNVALNNLPDVPYLHLDWTREYPKVERVDRLIASDVCYLPQHPQDLCDFAGRMGTTDVEVVVTDPGRKPSRRMRQAFREAGWDTELIETEPGGGIGMMVFRR